MQQDRILHLTSDNNIQSEMIHQNPYIVPKQCLSWYLFKKRVHASTKAENSSNYTSLNDEV